MLEINKIADPPFQKLILIGEVDASTSIQLDQMMEEVTSEGLVLIDCTHLAYISSAGLGVFNAYFQDAEGSGNKLVLYGLSEKIKSVFELVGLDQFLSIAENEDEAKKLINESSV